VWVRFNGLPPIAYRRPQPPGPWGGIRLGRRAVLLLKPLPRLNLLARHELGFARTRCAENCRRQPVGPRPAEGALRPALVLIANDQSGRRAPLRACWRHRDLHPAGVHRSAGHRPRPLRSARRDPARCQLPDIHGFDVCRPAARGAGHRACRTDHHHDRRPLGVASSGSRRAGRARGTSWPAARRRGDAGAGGGVRAGHRDASPLARGRAHRGRDGLYTSRGLLRRLREVVADATRRRQPLACVVFHARRRPGCRARYRNAGAPGRCIPPCRPGVRRARPPVAGRVRRRRACHRRGWCAPTAERLTGVLSDDLASLGVRLRTGFSAVEDASETRLDEEELLRRASGQARGGSGNGAGH